MINYIKSFKEYIPTWIICVFMFFWIYGWTFAVGVSLLVIQCIQRRKIKRQVNELKNAGEIEFNGKSDEISLDRTERIKHLEEEIREKTEKIERLERKGDVSAKHEFVSCAGDYLVGRDIPLGGYVFKQTGDSSAYISLYPNYGKFKKEEDEIVYESFKGKYHLSLVENGTYLRVENADIYRVCGMSETEFEKKEEISAIKSELKTLNNELISKYYIFSDYERLTSQDCKNELAILKTKEKSLRNSERDIEVLDKTESKKMAERAIRQILRNFNTDCDNQIMNIGLKNIDVVRNRIQKSYDTLNKLYSVDSVALSEDLLSLKLEQATLLYTYELKYQQEREIQEAIKEQMREEAKAEREIQVQKEKIEKDLQQHLGEINRLMKYMQKSQIDAERQLYVDRIKELEDKIKLLEADKETVLEREANAKAGFVYIISNIGSFGEDVYKIGMTRRLEPMDRVKELSSASVPFEFDVHAMIFSSDAPELETMLHRHFSDRAVNKINPRKEFYKVDIDEIEKVVKENYNDTVQFTKIPVATEYRQSLELEKGGD